MGKVKAGGCLVKAGRKPAGVVVWMGRWLSEIFLIIVLCIVQAVVVEVVVVVVVVVLVVVVVVVVVIVVPLLSPPPLVVSDFLSLFLEESSGTNVVSPFRRW